MSANPDATRKEKAATARSYIQVYREHRGRQLTAVQAEAAKQLVILMWDPNKGPRGPLVRPI